MRQIFLDTETTGYRFTDGHRIVEIGLVEVVDRKLTGRELHYIINPDRDIPEDVVKVHGIDNEKVKGKPYFKDVAAAIVKFLEGAEVLAHNSEFDVNFLNGEFSLCAQRKMWEIAERVVDTLALSRRLDSKERKHTLDALCARHGIDNSHREQHGALLDARLLAEVYIKMTEGVDLSVPDLETDVKRPAIRRLSPLQVAGLRVIPPSPVEASAHADYLEGMGKETGKDPIGRLAQASPEAVGRLRF